jgi:hypothetical protein
VSAFLTREAKRGVAAATQSQALNAVVVLYRKVLDMPLAEVEALLGAVEDVAHPKPRAKPWSACELLSASRPPFGLPLAGCLRFARLSPPWLAGLVTQERYGKHHCLRAWLGAANQAKRDSQPRVARRGGSARQVA